MSKVFKVIMNIVLILLIISLCAVFIPPFLGITTAVASPGIESNIQTGSIVYGTRESLNDLQAGDEIVVTSEDSAYVYEITEVDASNGEVIVRESEDSDTEIIQLRRTASKVFISVPLLGYILIATQSFEGLIILALAVALIIILFIIATVVNRQSDDEYEDDEKTDKDEDNDFGYFRDLAASTSRPNRLDELGTLTIPPITDDDIAKTRQISPETAPLDEEIEDVSELILEPAAGSENETAEAEGAQETSDTRPIDTDELASEASSGNAAEEGSQKESEAQDAEAKADESPAEPEASTSEAAAAETGSEEEKPEVSSATSDLSGIENALENVLTTDELEKTSEKNAVDALNASFKNAQSAEPEVAEEKPKEIELAIPVRTLDELLQEAYTKGEDPQVKKDPVTGITFVDYSSSFNN
ncbi:MAG TPA: hypothetical protein IAB17_06595 [Candidatus Alectryocaccobium stercorigallinarum]|nr:hypothetical protein [Candidatus Alectryocaccobium stercorigallinarum]